MELLDRVYFGNSVADYAIAAAVALGAFAALMIVRVVVARRLARFADRTTNRLDDLITALIEGTRRWALLVFGVFFGSLTLALEPEVDAAAVSIATIALLLQIGIWASTAIRRAARDVHTRRMERGDTAGLGAIQMLSLLGRTAAWVIVSLLILANVGVDVSALIAGLGIGGIAVALAAQNILGDLFASVAIVLDKPFQVGDFLILGDFLGTVENIGLKTTRLRSLSGEQIVMCNSDLLNSRVRNYKRMAERRVVFSFAVPYGTDLAVVREIPAWVAEIIEAEENVRFDRSHFQKFGDSALIYETVYYVLSPDYTEYMDVQQRINVALCERLAAAGVQFALPSRTLYVSKLD